MSDALTAPAVLSTVLRNYDWAKLGTVTRVDRDTGMGGLSLIVDVGLGTNELKVLLSVDDLRTAASLIEEALAAYHLTKSQSLRLSEGSSSDVVSPDEVLK